MSTIYHLGCALKCKQMYKKGKPVHIYKKQNVVAFSGTKSVMELPRSLNMFKTDDDIHMGYKKYAEMCVELIDFEELDTSKRITFTAHSMGAIAASLIAMRHPYDFELILFGSPKPGGKDFVEHFNRHENIRVYNYMHVHDIVQYFPFIDYVPLTDEYIMLNRVRKDNVISNHGMECYIDNLRNDVFSSIPQFRNLQSLLP